MTYYTTRCPHCGGTIQFMTKSKDSYGIPFKKCGKCGEPYIDPNCIEPATEMYEYKAKASYLVQSMLFGFFAAIFAFFGVDALFDFGNVIAAGAAAAVVFIAVTVIMYRTATSDYDEQEAKWHKMWEESDKRLQNPEYAAALKKAGFLVPLRYFEDSDEEE